MGEGRQGGELMENLKSPSLPLCLLPSILQVSLCHLKAVTTGSIHVLNCVLHVLTWEVLPLKLHCKAFFHIFDFFVIEIFIESCRRTDYDLSQFFSSISCKATSLIWVHFTHCCVPTNFCNGFLTHIDKHTHFCSPFHLDFLKGKFITFWKSDFKII